MKRKILCLALCVVMVFASLVGCQEQSREDIMNEIGREASAGASTVTMYLLSEKPVSAEQEALVEAAVNEYMDDYSVYLDLVYYTENEYYTILESNLDMMLKKAAEDKANKKTNKVTETATDTATEETTETAETVETAEGETSAATESGTTAATQAATEKGTVTIETDEFGNKVYLYIDENGLPKVYYPPNAEYHVDIFYFSGYDRYLKYRDAGYLANFSNPIKDTSAKIIKNGVSSVLYDAVKTLNTKYDMMPCNTQVGEYTYLLLNKDVLNSTQYTAAQVGNLLSDSCGDFLKFVNDYYPDYVPLYSSEGTLPLAAVNFFGVDQKGYASDDFSLLAGTYDYSWVSGESGQSPAFDKITASADNGFGTIKSQIEILKSYEFNGYYATADEKDKPFAVGYIKGDASIPDQYKDDYEVLVLEKPKLETDELYENVFAISSYTKQLSKTALVLSEIYTNENVINLLAHGIEGTNYVWTNSDERDPENNYEQYKVIEKITDDARHIYDMDPAKIGNAARTYPTTEDNPQRTKYILKQNSEATPSLTFGFSILEADYTELASRIKKAQKENRVLPEEEKPNWVLNMRQIAIYSNQAYTQLVNAKDAAALKAAFANIDTLLTSPEFDKIADLQKAYSKAVK